MRIPGRRGLVAAAALGLLGVVVAAVVAVAVFLQSEREVVALGHETTLSPTLRGDLRIGTGPVVPDVRRDLSGGVLPGGAALGVDLRLGKTTASSLSELTQRYAFIASQPDAQVAKIRDEVRGMAVAAGVRGLVAGVLVPLLWWLPGPARRRALLAGLRRPGPLLATGTALVLVTLAVWQPWRPSPAGPVEAGPGEWMPLREYVGAGVPLPPEAAALEVRGDVTTAQTRRLIRSAVDTYASSQEFYSEATTDAASLDLRQPAEDEGVAVLVSDRHDNIGMDPVARAIGDAAGATAVLDAGDDTSTGSRWEAFSLDSLDEAFSGYDKYVVTGNHDHGDFVGDYLAERGWTVLDGTVVDGPFGSRLLGLGDPRSSGLGSWRNETGLSFDEVEDRLADAACDAEERVDTVLVHDGNLGREALRRGCTDLVLGGHTHVHSGPTRVEGPDGEVGYRYTTGTTGGAAYAIAIGSKPRRAAEVSLVTYRDGEPVGVQWVVLQSDGSLTVSDYEPLLTDEIGFAQQTPR